MELAAQFFFGPRPGVQQSLPRIRYTYIAEMKSTRIDVERLFISWQSGAPRTSRDVIRAKNSSQRFVLVSDPFRCCARPR